MEKKSYKVGVHPQYTAEEWKEIMEANPIINRETLCQLEEQRCEADLLYNIMFNPNRIESDGRRTIDVVLKIMLDIITHIYGDSWQHEYPMKNTLKYLSSDQSNHYAKLFFILTVLAREPQASTYFIDMAKPQDPANLFKDNYTPHFMTFVGKLQEVIEKIKMAPFSELNIIQLIEENIRMIKRLYMTE